MSVESLLYSLSNITELRDITIYVRFLSLDLLVEGQVSVCCTPTGIFTEPASGERENVTEPLQVPMRDPTAIAIYNTVRK